MKLQMEKELDEDQCHQCNKDGGESVKHAKKILCNRIWLCKKRDMKIQIQIFNRGPIVCGVLSTQELDDFEGGYIFSQQTNKTMDLNIGWSKIHEGAYWGDRAFAKIKMHSDNLLLEHYFNQGVPKL